jgi:hypothetical protein
MDVQSIANTMFLLLGIVCVILSIRAFYVYWLSQSDPLFIIGIAMATIALAIFCGYVKDIHLVTANTKWAWYAGTTGGALFLVLNARVRAVAQFHALKNWQWVATVLFLLVVIITPFLPAFANPFIPAFLNIFRSLIYIWGFINYVMIYVAKRTRFSLLMGLGFLAIGAGFGTLTPQIFQPDLAVLVIIASSLRIVGYSTLLTAYSVG